MTVQPSDKKINALIKICDSILYQECIDAKEAGFFIKIQKIIFVGQHALEKLETRDRIGMPYGTSC